MFDSLINSLPLVRRATALDTCAVCHRAVRSSDARLRLPGGGWVHRGCSTYRMRNHDRARRRARQVL